MPVVHASGAATGRPPEEDTLKNLLLERIANAAQKVECEISDDSSDEDVDNEEVETRRLRQKSAYQVLIDKTRDLPLEKVVLSVEGCAVFDELCLRVDVNQKYADFLPQWTDLAHLLEVDALRTKWVETCVRPREGLTRAMLEIYMRDGGTLGDVLGALFKLECYDILEMVRPKAERFLNSSRRRLSLLDNENNDKNYFSVLKTLVSAFGQSDPCVDIFKFADGLKRRKQLTSAVPPDVIVQHVDVVLNNSELPKFQSDLHHLEHLRKEERKICKILLLFSEDGVQAAREVVQMADIVEEDGVKVELFRLNEARLWYEVLTNPEACCFKWSQEADYIMPILTPKFLQDIHCSGDNAQGLLPTSPILNRYLYTLARSQYTQAGCKNFKVRPVIPLEFLQHIRTSVVVKFDPLLNTTWVPLNQERLTNRLKGMYAAATKRVEG